jgi:hypothetical protein
MAIQTPVDIAHRTLTKQVSFQVYDLETIPYDRRFARF